MTDVIVQRAAIQNQIAQPLTTRTILVDCSRVVAIQEKLLKIREIRPYTSEEPPQLLQKHVVSNVFMELSVMDASVNATLVLQEKDVTRLSHVQIHAEMGNPLVLFYQTVVHANAKGLTCLPNRVLEATQHFRLVPADALMEQDMALFHQVIVAVLASRAFTAMNVNLNFQPVQILLTQPPHARE